MKNTLCSHFLGCRAETDGKVHQRRLAWSIANPLTNGSMIQTDTPQCSSILTRRPNCIRSWFGRGCLVSFPVSRTRSPQSPDERWLASGPTVHQAPPRSHNDHVGLNVLGCRRADILGTNCNKLFKHYVCVCVCKGGGGSLQLQCV